MTDGIWNQLTDSLLSDMRQHVRNLQDRVIEAGDVLQQSQGVNEKITVMKEYKDEAGTVNSCFRSKDRAGLVRSLQHENRQILSLQEENRQMKLALEDIQRGMTLIMEKHRKAVQDFERSNLLLDLMKQRFDDSQKNNVYEKRFYELVDLVDGIFKEMSEQHSKDMERHAAVCAENTYLRQALASRGIPVPGTSSSKPEASPNQAKSSVNTRSGQTQADASDETPEKRPLSSPERDEDDATPNGTHPEIKEEEPAASN